MVLVAYILGLAVVLCGLVAGAIKIEKVTRPPYQIEAKQDGGRSRAAEHGTPGLATEATARKRKLDRNSSRAMAAKAGPRLRRHDARHVGTRSSR